MLVQHKQDCRDDKEPPAVLWLHYKRNPPRFLSDIVGKEYVRSLRTYNPARRCCISTPGSPAATRRAGPHLAHIQQPILPGQIKETDPRGKSWSDYPRFCLLSSLPDNTQGPEAAPHPHPGFPVPSASQQLLNLANYWAHDGYHFISIDLEEVHTLAGVVGSIIDQCRKYDSALAPSVLPCDGADAMRDDSLLELAAERALGPCGARLLPDLRRSGDVPLAAHLAPRFDPHGRPKDGKKRLGELCEFLIKLADPKTDLGESRVGIGVDDPKARHSNEDNEHRPSGKYEVLSEHIDLKGCVASLKATIESVPVGGEHVPFDRLFEVGRDHYPLIFLKKPSAALTERSPPPGQPLDAEVRDARRR